MSGVMEVTGFYIFLQAWILEKSQLIRRRQCIEYE